MRQSAWLSLLQDASLGTYLYALKAGLQWHYLQFQLVDTQYAEVTPYLTVNCTIMKTIPSESDRADDAYKTPEVALFGFGDEKHIRTTIPKDDSMHGADGTCSHRRVVKTA